MKSQQGEIHNRIAFIIRELGYPAPLFARKLGVSIPSVKRVIEKKADPSYQMLSNIVRMFPVNPDWLFAGSGTPWSGDIEEFKYHEDTGLTTIPKEANEEINTRIRNIRLYLGISQASFGNELKLSRDIISAIENFRQNVTGYMLVALRDKYNVNFNWLFYGDGNMFRDKQTAEPEIDYEKLAEEIVKRQRG